MEGGREAGKETKQSENSLRRDKGCGEKDNLVAHPCLGHGEGGKSPITSLGTLTEHCCGPLSRSLTVRRSQSSKKHEGQPGRNGGVEAQEEEGER